jgi:hypothetical protein
VIETSGQSIAGARSPHEETHGHRVADGPLGEATDVEEDQ